MEEFLLICLDIWQQFGKHTMQDLRGIAHEDKNINVVPPKLPVDLFMWALIHCCFTEILAKTWAFILDSVFLAAEVGRVHSHAGVHWE